MSVLSIDTLIVDRYLTVDKFFVLEMLDKYVREKSTKVSEKLEDDNSK